MYFQLTHSCFKQAVTWTDAHMFTLLIFWGATASCSFWMSQAVNVWPSSGLSPLCCGLHGDPPSPLILPIFTSHSVFILLPQAINTCHFSSHLILFMFEVLNFRLWWALHWSLPNYPFPLIRPCHLGIQTNWCVITQKFMRYVNIVS